MGGKPFHRCTHTALSPKGEIYVSDGYGNAKIHKYSPDGKLLKSWGEPGSGPGQFHVVHGIAVDAAGTVYIADRENSRIQLFSSDGEFVGEWTDVARPCQLAIDRAGWIYIAELGFRAGRWPGWGPPVPGQTGGRVSIFDSKGKLHARFGGGENPCAPGDFFAPHGIWVDSRGDLYVSEVALAGGARAGLVDGSCHTLQKLVRI
jgi:DNA-binding beta-propeller fold protein YncE